MRDINILNNPSRENMDSVFCIFERIILGNGGNAVVQWLSTALQTGWSRDRFPMVSLEFFIDIILSAAL
jgi:hypothetical protein